MPPKKMPVKKKRTKEIEALVSEKAAREQEKRIKKAIEALDEITDERYEFAQKILKGQPESVERAVSTMVESMKAMAGPPNFRFEGRSINADEGWQERVQTKNFTWIAARLLIACAEWDIRIADFKPPKGICVKCGKKVKHG